MIEGTASIQERKNTRIEEQKRRDAGKMECFQTLPTEKHKLSEHEGMWKVINDSLRRKYRTNIQ